LGFLSVFDLAPEKKKGSEEKEQMVQSICRVEGRLNF
jgi:hypothetical protein